MTVSEHLFALRKLPWGLVHAERFAWARYFCGDTRGAPQTQRGVAGTSLLLRSHKRLTWAKFNRKRWFS